MRKLAKLSRSAGLQNPANTDCIAPCDPGVHGTLLALVTMERGGLLLLAGGWVAMESDRSRPLQLTMNRLLIIIGVILVVLILSSLSLYRICLSS